MSCATSALRPSGKRLKGTLRATGTAVSPWQPRARLAGFLRRTWPSTRTAPVTALPLGQARAWWRPWRRGRYLVGWWATKKGLVRCLVSLVEHCLERLGLLLGVPRQQVAPGRVAGRRRTRRTPRNALGPTLVSPGASASPSPGILSNCRRHATRRRTTGVAV